MRISNFKMIRICLLLILGILFASFLDVKLHLILPITVFLFFIVFFVKYKKTTFVFFNYLFWFCFGSTLLLLHNPMLKTNHFTHQNLNTIVVSTINIDKVLSPNATHNRYYGTIKAVNGKTASGKVLVYLKSNIESIKINTELLATSIFTKIKPAWNPFGFDYKNYLSQQKITHKVYLDSLNIVSIKPSRSIATKVFLSVEEAKKQLASVGLSSNTKGLLLSLLFGDRQELSPELKNQFTQAGVIHVLALSGLHIGVLYVLLLFLTAPLKQIKKGYYAQLIFIIVVLWIYAFIVGFPSSIVRGVTMFSVVAFCKLINRESNTYNNLAISAFILLLYNPYFIFDVGFQLSFVAVLGIVLGYPLYKNWLQKKHLVIRYFGGLFFVSFSAQLAVLPLLLYYFHQLPLFFLIANLLIVPMVLVLFVFGIALFISFYILPFLITFLVHIVNAITLYLDTVTQFISNLPFASLQHISFNAFLAITLALLIAFFVNLLYKQSRFNFKLFLASLVLFQIIVFASNYYGFSKNELVFYNAKSVLFSIKSGNSFTVFTDDKTSSKNNIDDYKRGSFISGAIFYNVPPQIQLEKNRLVVIDSSGYYSKEFTNSIVYIHGSPKINFNRMLLELKPKYVVFSSYNYYYLQQKWEQSCLQKNIPFWSISKKGYCVISLED